MVVWRIKLPIFEKCCVANSEHVLVSLLSGIDYIVIAATEIYRKKNKFQWSKYFMTMLTSRDILFFDNEKYGNAMYGKSFLELMHWHYELLLWI